MCAHQCGHVSSNSIISRAVGRRKKILLRFWCIFERRSHFHQCLGVVLKLRKAFWGGGGPKFLTFSYKGGGGGQVASYVIFFNLIFNKYKFYHRSCFS